MIKSGRGRFLHFQRQSISVFMEILIVFGPISSSISIPILSTKRVPFLIIEIDMISLSFLRSWEGARNVKIDAKKQNTKIVTQKNI